MDTCGQVGRSSNLEFDERVTVETATELVLRSLVPSPGPNPVAYVEICMQCSRWSNHAHLYAS